MPVVVHKQFADPPGRHYTGGIAAQRCRDRRASGTGAL